MSRETQAGTSSVLPLTSSTLNAATPPFFVTPLVIGNLNCECAGPQNGLNTQRAPFASTYVASEPQMPAEAKFTSSLQNIGVVKRSVRWSSPPMDAVSIIHRRHSLLPL